MRSRSVTSRQRVVRTLSRASRSALAGVALTVVAGALAVSAATPAAAGAATEQECGLGPLASAHYSGLSQKGTTCGKARTVAKAVPKHGSYNSTTKGFHCHGKQSFGLNPAVTYICKRKGSVVSFTYSS